jgi:hypothetical protein
MAKYILSDIELEESLSEIVTGKKIFHYNNEIMGMRYPTLRDRDNSRTIYVMKYKELENSGLPKKDDLKILLLKTGALEPDFYSKKNKLEEDLKKLYNARQKTGSPIQLIQIDADIDLVTKSLIDMEILEDNLMINSLEYNAESYRINYLISTITLRGIELEDRQWKTYNDFLIEKDQELILECKRQYRQVINGMPQKKIRAIARSDEWKKRWDVSKKTGSQVFEGASSDWDKNKVNLCYWSNFYDNIIDNLKLKNNDILDDDDALFEMIRKINNGQKKDSDSNGTGNTVNVSTPYKVRY